MDAAGNQWFFGPLNPEFALGRGIRRTMPDFFFLKKFARSPRYALTFFVEKVSASFVSALAPNAKSGCFFPNWTVFTGNIWTVTGRR
jgi:hypothetical protein